MADTDRIEHVGGPVIYSTDGLKAKFGRTAAGEVVLHFCTPGGKGLVPPIVMTEEHANILIAGLQKAIRIAAGNEEVM